MLPHQPHRSLTKRGIDLLRHDIHPSNSKGRGTKPGALYLTLLGGSSGLISPLRSLQWEIWFSLLLPVMVWIGVKLARLRIILAAVCFALIAVGANIDRVLQWFGRISFSLYLVHEPIVVPTAYLFGDSGLVWAIPIAIAVSILIAAGFYRVVEMPAHRLSRRVGDAIRRRQHARRGEPSPELDTAR